MNPCKTTLKTALTIALTTSLLWANVPSAQAETSAATIDEMAAYLEFSEYGGGVMFAEQIPREDWKLQFWLALGAGRLRAARGRLGECAHLARWL